MQETMNLEEQIMLKRIKELVKDLDLSYVTREEYDKQFMQQSVIEIKDEMWLLYSFALDVYNTLHI